MKFAIAFANVGPTVEPDSAIAFAQAAEANGFESLWTVEHVVVPANYESPYPYDPSGKMPGGDDSPIPDPLIWLSYIASATTTLKLGTGVLILPQRNPVVLAKELSTLDFMSKGRVLLGVGVGWLREEFDAIGVPFNERGVRTDDNIAALRALWTQDQATYKSKFIDFENCIIRPRPQNGTIPIHVGGHSDAAARRAGRIGDGFFPGKGDHTELARLFNVTRDAAKEAGRDPEAIEFTAGGNGVVGGGALDELKALADLGVTRVVVPSFLFWGDSPAKFERYYEDVISKAG